jgi:hypothetical protein
MDYILDSFKGLWRSSAMEGMDYTDDFPEALLVSPEFFDGSINHGRATEITITFVQRTETDWTLSVKDTGRGLVNVSRFLSWAASSSQTSAHRNGHGHKKALTKFAPDYDTAHWRIRYRHLGGALCTIRGPYMGIRTPQDEDETDMTTLMPSGTETEVNFNASVLGRYTDPISLRGSLEELITSRYPEDILRRVKFIITIRMLDGRVETANSHAPGAEWHSFRYYVLKGVRDGYIRALVENADHASLDAPWRLSVYKITVKGSTGFELRKKFPTYGPKNIRGQRVYIALGDRIIEAAPLYPFIGRSTGHNDENGIIVFVDFISPDLAKQPQPCTTKVSMYANDEIYKQFRIDLGRILPDILSGVDGGSIAPPPDGSDSEPEYQPVHRVDMKHLVGQVLGVTFHQRNGQVLFDRHDGTGMHPLRAFRLVPVEEA